MPVNNFETLSRDNDLYSWRSANQDANPLVRTENSLYLDDAMMRQDLAQNDWSWRCHNMSKFSAWLDLYERDPPVRWISLTKEDQRCISCLRCCYLGQALKQTIDSLAISDAMLPVWHHCNVIVCGLQAPNSYRGLYSQNGQTNPRYSGLEYFYRSET